MANFAQRTIVQYLVAIASVLVVVALRFALGPVLGQGAPLILFLLSVAFSAWYGGFGPGVLATLVGMFLGFALFAAGAPASDPSGPVLYWATRGLPFVFVGAALSFFAARLESARAAAKQNALQAYESEEFVRRVLASSTDCIKVLDLDGNLLSMNESGIKLMQIGDLRPLIGTNWSGWWRGDQREHAERAVAQARAGANSSFLAPSPTFGGELRWWDVSVSPILATDGHPERLLCVARDITARREADMALRRSEDLQRQIFESVRDFAIFTIDLEGHITSWNIGAERVFGYREAEALGSNVETLFTPEDRLAGVPRKELAMARRDGRSSEDRWHLRKDGVRFFASGVVTPLHDDSDTLVGFTKVARDVTEQQKIRQDLATAVQRLDSALIAGEVATFDWDVDADRVHGDENFARMFCIAVDAAGSASLADYVGAMHVDDRDRVTRLIQHSVDSGDNFDTEYRIVRGDGERWVIARGRMIKNAQGKVVHFPGVILDITERKNVERDRELLLATVEQKDVQLRQLADAMPQIVWAANPAGELDYYNQRWFEYIDLKSDRIEDARWDQFIHPDDLQRTYDQWMQSLRSGDAYGVDFRVRRADGQYRWFLARALPARDPGGIIYRWFGTCTDIHDQRQLQLELERSEALFRQLADTIPQLAWMANPDGGVFWYNQRWYDYTGTQPEQMQGWGWQSVHDPLELPRVMERWKASIHSGEPFDMTFPIRGADGGFRPFLTRVMPFRDEKNQIALWFGTNTDVSEQRAMVEERDALLASERAARGAAEHASRMKDEFLATVSHELRTPLSAILGWTQVLIARRLPGEELTQALEAIQRNARVQTQLIEDLLDMSRIISGKLRLDVQPVQPTAFIEAAIETVSPAAAAKGIRLEKVLDPFAGPISGDPNRLQQVIWNLLSNAIKFTPRGGRVQILLERVNSHIEIGVSDTGQGISADFLPRVFDRFLQADSSATRKYGGLGLGLAIVKHLTELHGGTVRVKSPGDKLGATFTVHLPLKIAHDDDGDREHPRTAVALKHEFISADLSGLKIVVVDDEPDARELLKRLLEGFAAHVEIAASASEGLSLIKASRPDVLISDIGMPEVDGYQFLQRVRALGSDDGGKIPAIALTAFARSEDRTRALLAGYLAHVSKPVEPAELAATIAAVVGRTGGAHVLG